MNTDKGKYWSKAWSLVEGCAPVSEGCAHCWLESMAHRFQKEISCDDGSICNLTNFTGEWTGEVIMMPNRLNIPLKTKKPQVFTIWSDLFNEKIHFEFINEAMKIMAWADHHTYLILTKRPKRMKEYYEQSNWDLWGFPYVYFGITCENQQRADERIPYLLQVQGKRFLSLEPLLNKIHLTKYFHEIYIQGDKNDVDPEFHTDWYDVKSKELRTDTIHQIIVGAESGSHRRPCNIEWVRSIVQQCKDAGVPCFVKQIHDEKGRIIKDINLFPEDLKVRELAWK